MGYTAMIFRWTLWIHFQLAILGTKGTWYDHTVSVRNAEPKTEDAAAETAAVPADGSYTCAVTLEGGSGRATVESPARPDGCRWHHDRRDCVEQPPTMTIC